MRRRHRSAPTVESINEEASEFRATAAELTREMEDLRRDIAGTAEDLSVFATRLREVIGDDG